MEYEEERSYTKAELEAFLRDKNGYAPKPQQPKGKATGKATLKFLQGYRDGKPVYENIMYLKDVALIRWKYKQLVTNNPSNKKNLKIDYEYK